MKNKLTEELKKVGHKPDSVLNKLSPYHLSEL